jgi:hypothetical protein
VKKSKHFFFEKKKQKTFTAGHGRDRAVGEDQKFFASFFQKRSASFFYIPPG